MSRTPKLQRVFCPDSQQGHHMAYWQWGDEGAAHTVVCVHGLTRQGRDFDVLAQALLSRARQPIRIICPDVVGRGQSDWLADALAYQVPTYAADMLVLLAKLQVQSIDWVGTSLGGLIGMAVSAHAAGLGLQVRKLVLNDVGPVLEWQSLQRIGSYLGVQMEFASFEQATAALWAISSSFGPHTPAQWSAMSQHMLKPKPDGQPGVVLHYDPAIALAFKTVTPQDSAQGTQMLWQLYDSITAQTLLLRGAQSDLLARSTAQEMTQRGPQARCVEFEGVGHAPTLIAADQLDVVSDFLLESV